jgi:hypothetical protein
VFLDQLELALGKAFHIQDYLLGLDVIALNIAVAVLTLISQ